MRGREDGDFEIGVGMDNGGSVSGAARLAEPGSLGLAGTVRLARAAALARPGSGGPGDGGRRGEGHVRGWGREEGVVAGRAGVRVRGKSVGSGRIGGRAVEV